VTALTDPAPLPANPLPARMDFSGALRHDVPIEAAETSATPKSNAAFGRPLFSVRRGRTVMLACVNRTDAPVTLHLHGHAFRLLDRLDDGWKPFWLDTIVLPPRVTTRVAFVADNPGKWLIERRAGAADMLPSWFEVT
jgi:FtsP/CotA-like multicopper oxidase with cupredoxin domain